jgi:hypothetical protein
VIEQELPEDVAIDRRRFFIDLQWYDNNNRSFRVMAQRRFCSSCQKKIGTEQQERVPAVDPKTGRVVFEMRNVPFGANPMSVIRTCCSKQRGFITSDTPLLEALFRVFLANGNQPADAERLREQLADWVTYSDRPHMYAADLIERVLGNDQTYGMREFALASA